MNTIALVAIIGIAILLLIIVVYRRRSKQVNGDGEEGSFEETNVVDEEGEEEITEEKIDPSAIYDANNIIQIRNQVGGCLSIPDGNNDTEPWIQKCNSSDFKQRWLYDSNASRLKSVFGSCLSESGGGVRGWVCEDGSKDQRWRYSVKNGHFEHLGTKTCLEAESDENDSKISTATCSRGDPKQRWLVKKVAYIR